jgi:hypothetical protein
MPRLVRVSTTTTIPAASPRVRCVLVAALLVAVPAIGQAESADELTRLRTENAALRAHVEALEREVAALRALADVPPDDDEPPLVATEPDEATGDEGLATRLIRLDRTRGSTGPHFFTLARDAAGTVTGRIETRLSGGIYEYTRLARLTVDGTSYDCAVTHYDKQRVTTGLKRRIQRDHERVAFAVAPEALAAMAEARSVGIALGRSAFTVPPRGLVALHLLATTPPAE